MQKDNEFRILLNDTIKQGDKVLEELNDKLHSVIIETLIHFVLLECAIVSFINSGLLLIIALIFWFAFQVLVKIIEIVGLVKARKQVKEPLNAYRYFKENVYYEEKNDG